MKTLKRIIPLLAIVTMSAFIYFETLQGVMGEGTFFAWAIISVGILMSYIIIFGDEMREVR